MKIAYRKLSVLLVDSISTCTDTLQGYLQDFQFFRLYTASSAEEALKLLAEKELHLMITAWKMQPMSGMQLVEGARKNPKARGLPILVMREKRDTYIEEKARPMGVNGFLDLPLNYQAVTQAVEGLLEIHVDPVEEVFGTNMNTGRQALRKGLLKKAGRAFAAALEVRSDHDAHLGLAEVLKQQEDSEGAEKQYMAALRANPLSLKGFLALADLYVEGQRYQEAVKVLTAAVGVARQLKSDGETQAGLLLNIGELRLRLKDLKSAMGCFSQAVKLDPDTPDVKVKIGDALAKEGHHAQAEGYYEEAIAQDPDKAHYYNRLGITYRQQGKSEQALELYRRVQQIRPDDENLMYNIARCLFDMQQYQPAADEVAKAMKIRPNFPEAKKLLDVALKRLGQETGAAPTE